METNTDVSERVAEGKSEKEDEGERAIYVEDGREDEQEKGK